MANRPCLIYQYSNTAPRLLGKTPIFGVVFFLSKCPLGIEGQEKLKKFEILTLKPQSHVRILMYRTWPIPSKRCAYRESAVFIQGIVVVFIKTNIQSKMMSTTTMISCRHISYREWPINVI